MEYEGINGAYSLKEFVSKLPKPRTIWLMIPHQTVDELLKQLVPLLQKGDTIIDGGNSPFKDSVQRAKKIKNKNINFLDIGVSGGPEGARYGASLMIGGDKELFGKYEYLFKDLSVKGGYGYMGKSGAGHFVKMVHNGIEYGMMQAIGEGFEVMKKSPFSLDLYSVADVYNHGSVITSRLIGWLSQAYSKFGDELNTPECCLGKVPQSGEGQWTVETAKELGVPVAIIEGAVRFRTKSQNKPSYTGRVVSALRHEFGGHEAKTNEE
ncbi:MAG: decarboxylating 6-phosphogluconate dehydrogenase [Patescibacteria group bacterium]|nr:decarboxylating 6-phosphogluconate dehydrogenase [Patescibacteria group bacterium]